MKIMNLKFPFCALIYAWKMNSSNVYVFFLQSSNTYHHHHHVPEVFQTSPLSCRSNSPATFPWNRHSFASTAHRMRRYQTSTTFRCSCRTKRSKFSLKASLARDVAVNSISCIWTQSIRNLGKPSAYLLLRKHDDICDEAASKAEYSRRYANLFPPTKNIILH